MRAYIEPDDDDTPIISVMVMENGNIVDGYFRAAHPKTWHLELGDLFDGQ